MGTLQSLVSAFFKIPLLKLWIELSRAALSLELLTAAGDEGGGGGGGGGAGGGNIVWFVEVGTPIDSWGNGGAGDILVKLLTWTAILSSAKI